MAAIASNTSKPIVRIIDAQNCKIWLNTRKWFVKATSKVDEDQKFIEFLKFLREQFFYLHYQAEAWSARAPR